MLDLEKYSIYELRIIARNLGVKSPTTKRHQQLVDEINKISKGDIAPNHFPKKGRPYKATLPRMYGESCMVNDEYIVIKKSNYLEIIEYLKIINKLLNDNIQ